MNETDTQTTATSQTWLEGDADLRRLCETKGALLRTVFQTHGPARPFVTDTFFGGSNFLWCTEGAFRFAFSDREPLVLRRGEFLVTFANRFLSIVGLESANDLRGGTLVGAFHEELLLQMGLYDCFTCRNVHSPHTFAHLQDLLERQSKGDTEAGFALLHHTCFILKGILASLCSGRDAFFYEAVRRLNANFLVGNVSAKALYAQMNCSPTRLIAIFREHGLQGPREYLRRLQSWRACRLLTRSHLTIDEIAQTCGFSGNSSFTRFFKDWMGISPADVRNGHPYRRRPPLQPTHKGV